MGRGRLLGFSWSQVLAAIHDPRAYGRLYGRRTESGFSFGLPASDITEAKVFNAMMGEFLDSREHLSGKPSCINHFAEFDKMINDLSFNTIVAVVDTCIRSQVLGGRATSDVPEMKKAALKMLGTEGLHAAKVTALEKLLTTRAESGTEPDYTANVSEPHPDLEKPDVKELAARMTAAMIAGVSASVEAAGGEMVGGAPEGEGEGKAEEAALPKLEAHVSGEFEKLAETEIIDTILAKVTGGKISSINVLIDAANKNRNEAVRIVSEANDLVERAVKSVPVAVAPPTTGVSTPSKKGAIPSGTMVMKPAYVMFAGRGSMSPAVKAMLSFDVPTFTWEHEHPFVPAIDKHYVFQPTQLVKLLLGLTMKQTPWLYGHTGCGKTSLVEQVCARLGWPFVRVNLDSEISRLDLIGRETLTIDEKGATKSLFIDGVLPMAMMMGAVLCLDEMDFIRPEVSYVINRTLEGNGLMIAEDGGREVKPAWAFRMVATANTKGQGDEYGIYAGARVQSAAVLDRFSPFIECGYLPEAPEVDLVVNKSGLDKPTATRLVMLGKEIRTAFSKGEIMQTFSPRGLVAAGANLVQLGKLIADPTKARNMALDMCVLDKASENDRPRIIEIAQRVFGGGVVGGGIGGKK